MLLILIFISFYFVPVCAHVRFLDNGWAGADSYDMVGVWSRLPPEEIARVTQIELLDEQELLHQLFTHYAITTAWTDHRWSEVQL